MSFTSDYWSEADMESVVKYLRGHKSLNVPPDMREALGMNMASGL